MPTKNPLVQPRWLLLGAVLAMGALRAQPATAPAAAGEPAKAWAEALAKRFATCFSAVGTAQTFPVAQDLPDDGDIVAEADIPAVQTVSDGYRHRLRVHGPSNSVYVVQTGGIAGRRTVFGPLPVDTDCRASERRKEAPHRVAP